MVAAGDAARARAIAEVARASPEFDLVTVLDTTQLSARDATPARVDEAWRSAEWAGLGLDVSFPRLRELAGTNRSTEAAIMQAKLAELCCADASFVVVADVVLDGRTLPPAFLRALEELFTMPIEVVAVDALPFSSLVALVTRGRRGVHRTARSVVAPLAERRGALRPQRPLPGRIDESIDADLLTAALAPAHETPTAWIRWLGRHDIEEIDRDAQSLASELYENLRSAPSEPAHLGRLRGMRRKAWYVDQLHRQRAVDITAHLKASGLAPVLGPEPAWALDERGGRVARAIRRLEVVVAPDLAVEAVEALAPLGWLPVDRQPIDDEMVGRRSDAVLQFESGPPGVRLIWALLPGSCGSDLGPAMVDDAVEADIQGERVAVLSLSARLLATWMGFADRSVTGVHRLVCDTAAAGRRRDEVAWEWLSEACSRLAIDDYARLYLDHAGRAVGDSGIGAHLLDR